MLTESDYYPRIKRGERKLVATEQKPQEPRPPQKVCTCGFRRRGPYHEQGSHHQGTVPRCGRR